MSVSSGGSGGAVEIFKQPASFPALPPNFTLLGQQLSITAPAQTAPNFLNLEFTLDGTFTETPAVFRNGAGPIADCTAAVTPDPCIDNVAVVGGDTVVTVHSTAASVWNFAAPGAPNEASEEITVLVPESDLGGGNFTIEVKAPGDSTVDMGTPTTGSQDGTFFLNYNALMDEILVTDDRLGSQAWTVVGQMSNFDPALIFGRYMGWTPYVCGQPSPATPVGSCVGAPAEDMGALPGGNVPSGYPGTGAGLHDSQILASASDGHEGGAGTDNEATMGGSLNLHVPTAVPAGSYTGTLTMTALS